MRGESVSGLPKRSALIECGLGVGCARKNAVATMLYHQRTKGLIAGEVIAQACDAMGGHMLGMSAQPAFARGTFTVLCVLSVLRHDVLWREGQDLGVARAHNHWGDGGMRRERLAIAERTPKTVWTMHGCGRKGVGAIKGHQQLLAQDTKMRQHAVLLKSLKDLDTHRIKSARGDRIEACSDVIVTGNLLHVEQGLGVMLPCGVLQPTLGRQKRRRLGEKDAQGAQGGILDGVSGVWPLFAMVRQWRDPSVQDAPEGIEASGVCHSSLLGPMEITTFTLSVSMDNRQPLTCQN